MSVDPSVQTEISDAVAQGFVVTIPQNAVSLEGWSGTGFVILDPQTGSGIYEISGGLNGGGESCHCFGFSAGQEFIIGLLLVAVAFLGPVAAIVATIIGAVVGVIDLFKTICELENTKCLGDAKGMLEGLAGLMFFIGLVVGIATLGGGVLLPFIGLYILFLALATSKITDLLANLAVTLNKNSGECT